MAKTFKKRLMLCFVLLMVMFVGASFSAINASNVKAAEKTNIETFKEQVMIIATNLDNGNLVTGNKLKTGTALDTALTASATKEKIFPAQKTDALEKVWSAYITAKGLYLNNVLDTEDKTELKGTGEMKVFDAVDKVFTADTDAYVLYAEVSNILYGLTSTKLYYEMKKVEDIKENFKKETEGVQGFIKAVTKYETYVATIDEHIKKEDDKIKALEDLIKAFPEIDYNDASKRAIEEAEAHFKGREENKTAKPPITAVEGLAEDIQQHDKDAYTKNHATPKPTKPADYEVEGYDKLVDARAKYDELVAQVNALVKKVGDMIDEDAKGNSVYDLFYKDIMPTYGATAVASKLTAGQRAEFEKAKYNGSVATYKGKTMPEILEMFNSMITELVAKSQRLNQDVEALYLKTLGAKPRVCVFGERKDLLKYYEEYQALEVKVQNYMSNKQLLLDMMKEYEEDKKLVDAWKATVTTAKLTTDPANKLDFTQFGNVDAAVDAYNKLVHADAKTDADKKLLQTVIDEDPDYATDKERYDAAVNAKADLIAQLKAIADKMGAIAITPIPAINSADAITKAETWTTNVGNIKSEFESFDKAHKGAEAYAKANFVTSYDNYQKALAIKANLDVELAIDKLYQSGVEDYETDPAVLIKKNLIKIAHYERIEAARKLFVDNNCAIENVRNHDKLVAAEQALATLTIELREFMRNVVKLADPTYVEVDNRAAIVQKLTDLASSDPKKAFKGYPLNLGVDTNKTELSLKNLNTKYTDLIKNDTESEKTNYLAAARTALTAFETASTKELTQLATDITTLTKTPVENFKAADITKARDLETLYNALHQTQRDKFNKDHVGVYEQLQSALDTIDAWDAFKGMLAELKEQAVTKGEVTTYTQYYLDAVKAIYDQFGEGFKATLTTYDADITAIENAITKAKADGKMLSLKDLVDNSAASLTKDLIDSFKKAEGSTAKTVKEAITEFKTEFKAAYEAAIKTAVDAAKKELEGKIKGLNDQLTALDKQIKDAAGNKTLKEVLDAQKAALEAAKTDLTAAKTELQGKIDAANGNITALQTALQTAQTELGKVDGKIKSAIDTAKDEITKAYTKAIEDAVKAAKTELEGKIKAATDDKSELQEQIDALKAQIEKLGTGSTGSTGTDNEALTTLQGKVAAIEEKIAGLDQAITDATAAKTTAEKAAADLKKEIADREQAITGLSGKITELETKLNSAKTALENTMDEKIAAAKKELETAYKDYTDQAIQALKNKEIKDANDQIDTLKSTLATLQSQVDALTGKGDDGNGYKEQIDALNAAIADINKKIEGITEAKNAADAAKKAAEDANSAVAKEADDRAKAIEAANKAIDDAKAELNKAINDAKASMGDYQSAIDAAKKELQGKIDALSGRIDSLDSSLTTVTIILIIACVLLVGAGVCIVILFIKRKA